MEVRLGTLTDYLVLSEEPYLIRYDAPTPADGADVRVVACELQMAESTPDALWGKARQAVQEMLNRAAAAIDENKPMSERVAFQVRLGTTDWTFFDVRSGRLDGFDHHATGISTYLTMTLTCLPYVRGEAIAVSNLLSASCDPEADAWTRTNVTAASDDATAPDGSETAATLRETTATGAHGLAQDVTKDAASLTMTGSIYVRADGRDAVTLSLTDSTGANGASVLVDIAAGYIVEQASLAGSGFSAASAAIENAGSDWWRVSLTATTTADTTLRFAVQCHDGSGTSYAGDDGLGVIVWGAQLEEAASAGPLLVPLTLPATVRAGYTIPGYEYEETDYSADPDNLWSGSWTVTNMTTAASQSDPSGGTGATRYTDNNTTSLKRWVRGTNAVSMSGLPKTWTFGVYLKNYSGRNTPTIALLANDSTAPDGFGVTTGVNLTTGVTSGGSVASGWTRVGRGAMDVGGGWWFAWLTVTVPSGAGSSLYGYVAPNGWNGYNGVTADGVLVFRPQIVEGATIDMPVSTVVVDDEEVPAEPISGGNLAGAYLYGIPGDAPALYRVELDDDSEDVAVNRLHVGAWSGRDVRLHGLTPFAVLTGGEGADLSSGDAQVGTYVAGINAQPEWQPVATLSVDEITGPRGWFGAILRGRDASVYLSQPGMMDAFVTDGIGAAMVKRLDGRLMVPQTSMSFGIPQTSPGATLVIMAEWLYLSGPATASISANGGASWSTLHTQVTNGRAQFVAWIAPDSAPLDSTLTVSWSDGMSTPRAVDEPGLMLIQIPGAASSPVDGTDVDITVGRDKDTQSGFASITTTQAATLLLSAGLGVGDWSQNFTIPVGDKDWYSVGGLTSGSIWAKTLSSAGAQSVRFTRMSLERGQDSPPEPWIVSLAGIKTAAATGADVTPGLWSLMVTAISDDGTESLAAGPIMRNVPSAASAVRTVWTPPVIGVSNVAGYRVYRNHGSGSAYAEVDHETLEYTFLDEDALTDGEPPTTAPPVVAWRLSISLPSGETLWRATRAVNSTLANGVFEDIALGEVPIPPIPAGEGETPGGALLTVEAAHIRGAHAAANGLWLYSRSSGQVIVLRDGMDATDPVGWVIDTNRDGISAGWLRGDGDTEAGQAVIEPGALTLAPDRAIVSIRPEVAGGESALPQSVLSLRRLLITPRWWYVRGRA